MYIYIYEFARINCKNTRAHWVPTTFRTAMKIAKLWRIRTRQATRARNRNIRSRTGRLIDAVVAFLRSQRLSTHVPVPHSLAVKSHAALHVALPVEVAWRAYLICHVFRFRSWCMCVRMHACEKTKNTHNTNESRYTHVIKHAQDKN